MAAMLHSLPIELIFFLHEKPQQIGLSPRAVLSISFLTLKGCSKQVCSAQYHQHSGELKCTQEIRREKKKHATQQ